MEGSLERGASPMPQILHVLSAMASSKLPERGGPQREFCLLKGIAEGTYNTKHAEAA